MRPRSTDGGRGQGAPRQGRQRAEHPQAEIRRPQRARLHRPGQDGLVRQLLPRRRLPLLGLSVHWAAGFRTLPFPSSLMSCVFGTLWTAANHDCVRRNPARRSRSSTMLSSFRRHSVSNKNHLWQGAYTRGCCPRDRRGSRCMRHGG